MAERTVLDFDGVDARADAADATADALRAGARAWWNVVSEKKWTTQHRVNQPWVYPDPLVRRTVDDLFAAWKDEFRVYANVMSRWEREARRAIRAQRTEDRT